MKAQRSLTGIGGLAMLGFALAVIWGTPARAELEPTISFRFMGGLEAELHLWKIGFGGSVLPNAPPVPRNPGYLDTCLGETVTRTFLWTRFFFTGVQDGWYLGAFTFSDEGEVSCPTHEETGAGPMLGYHWLWDSGFNVDLGLRPGGLALGWSF